MQFYEKSKACRRQAEKLHSCKARPELRCVSPAASAASAERLHGERLSYFLFDIPLHCLMLSTVT